MKPLIPLLLAAILPHARAEEWKPLALLNGRLTVSMPEGAKVEARGHGIMGAPESNESETRVVFEHGDKKMVLMAWELFQLAGAGYEAEVDKSFKEWGKAEETEFKVSRKDKLALGTAEKPNAADDAILYTAGFFRNADDSVQRVALYFNPEFHKTPERCRELAEKVTASLTAGKRKLNLAAGKRSLGGMSIDLPARWAFSTKQGVDFHVYNLEEVSDFGSPEKSIGIYVGMHPGYHHKRIEEEEPVKKERKAMLLGKEREWMDYSVKQEGARKSSEVIAPLNEGMMIHVFVSAPDDKGLDELLKIAASVKAEKAGGKR